MKKQYANVNVNQSTKLNYTGKCISDSSKLLLAHYVSSFSLIKYKIQHYIKKSLEKSLYLKIIERLFVKSDRDLYSGYSTRCPLNGSIIIIIDMMDNLNQFESIAIFFYPRYKSRKYKKKDIDCARNCAWIDKASD